MRRRPVTEARELLEDQPRRLRAGALGLEEIAADGEDVGVAVQREIHDAGKCVGESGAAPAASAGFGEDGFEM